MCSIMVTRNKIKELVEINQFRGNFSWSVYDMGTNKVQKGFGTFPINNNFSDNWKIMHVQAPTGGLKQEENRIHPTEIDSTKLWHNGIITPRGVRYMQQKLNTNEDFDTLLLHKMINKYGFDCLSDIEGGFACLYLKDNNVYIFRTQHLKLHINEECITSERAPGTKIINADTIYQIEFNEKLTWKEVSYFKTKRYNYIIKGEL